LVPIPDTSLVGQFACKGWNAAQWV
jgi:hypothetical protein